ncbi:MAG TPA: response regulator [Bacillus sp. (in: firmicutes)]|nr:response regulator [Bacillus sp. (in: firmicutes)]
MDIKMILADDEMIERKAMKKLIEDHFGEGLVIGEAANGRQAIELADKLHPDLILMDVKMPGINGLEAIEKIQIKHKNIKFIMVSAYDSFEYVKKAMNEGVKEYILKPAEEEETIQTIIRVYQEILREREQIQKQRQSLEISRQYFLKKIIGFNINEETWCLKNELFPDMKCGYFIIYEWEDDQDIHFLLDRLNNWTDSPFIYHVQKNQMILFFILQERIRKEEIIKLGRRLFIASGNKTWIGLGHPYDKLEDLPRSYQDALLAIQQIKKFKKGGYSFPTNASHSMAELKDKIVDCILKTESIQAFQQVKDMLRDEKNIEIIQEFHFEIKQALHKKGIHVNDFHIRNWLELDEWEKFLQYCCLQVHHYFHSKGYIERAKTYIQQNYHKPITLEEVAEHVDLSAPYFTKLFKEKTNKTFIDYLTEIRLTKAKELLLEHQLSFKEICFQVGYRDPNYFSRVFKKYYHLSPREFQNQILKK